VVVPVVNGEWKLERFMQAEKQPRGLADGEGKFELSRSLPGRKLYIDLHLLGYHAPRGQEQGIFDSGSHPDLQLTLVRDGAVRTSVIATKPIVHKLAWQLSDGTDGADLELQEFDGIGLVEREIRNVRPGTYRARLVDCGSNGTVLTECEGVVVRAGERTIDPRLCGIELSRFAGLTAPVPPEAPAHTPIVVELRDARGSLLTDGRANLGESGWGREWHAGRLTLGADELAASLAIWCPGCRVWVGPCPQASTTLRLEPAYVVTLKVEIPSTMQRPDWRFRIQARAVSGNTTMMSAAANIPPVELDAGGLARVECPGECGMSFQVQVLALDASGSGLRAGPAVLTGLNLELPASGGVHVISAEPDEWAGLEKSLAGGH
jgi:hypothetical protein